MSRTLSICAVLVLGAAHGQAQAPANGSAPPRPAPVCKVEPSWPTVPDNWIFGAMAGIATDSIDNVWIVHRGAGVTMKKACCKAAPSSCSSMLVVIEKRNTRPDDLGVVELPRRPVDMNEIEVRCRGRVSEPLRRRCERRL